MGGMLPADFDPAPSIAPHAPAGAESATPHPGRIVAMMTAFEQTAALKAALSLGLFTAVARGADTPERLAERCGCALRSARVLADTLTVHGLLEKSHGRYALASDAAAFLVQDAPAYLGDAARFLASPEKIALYFDDIEGWARRGGPAHAANVSPDSEVWVDFARGMATMMSPAAFGTAEALKAALDPPPHRILDVAAGHGLFGVACLKAFEASEVTAMDWAAVLAVAAETAVAAGVSARWSGRPGSAFDLVVVDRYDLVLVPNFLHHFDAATCVGFLRQAASALTARGAIAIVEYVPDDDRVSPPAAALFALSMLTGTPAGDVYTVAELRGLCAQAGLFDVRVEPVPGTVQTLLLARRGAAQ